MQKKSVGRPKKQNAVKSGQLKKGECRYTFITSEKEIRQIKSGAKDKEVTIKKYMKIILNYYWESNELKTKDEQLLKLFQSKRLPK